VRKTGCGDPTSKETDTPTEAAPPCKREPDDEFTEIAKSNGVTVVVEELVAVVDVVVEVAVVVVEVVE
jgi:hypothetical protein